MTLPTFDGEELSVAEAAERYGKGKTAINSRIKHLGIKPVKRGHKTWLSADDLKVLDSLHDHIEAGGGMNDFDNPIAQLVEEEVATERSAIVPTEPTIPIMIQSPPAAMVAMSKIEHLTQTLSFLDLCAEKGWTLPTTDLQAILGFTPRQSGLNRYGFTFEAAGSHGRETAWAILKDDYVDED